MRSRQVLAVVAVVLVVSSGPAMAKAKGEPSIRVLAPDNDVTPGEDAQLELYLQNAGDVVYATSAAEEARVTTARDVRVAVEAGDAPVDVETGIQPVGNVPEGRSDAIAFDLSVFENATPGEYTLPVTVEYQYTAVVGSGDGAYDDKERTLETSVTLAVEDDARFRIVDASADDLFANSGPVTLTVENTGTATARDARVAVQSGSAQLTFGGAETAETFVGDWRPGERRTVSVESELAAGADRRSYPLTATVAYEDMDGESQESESLTAGVTPRRETRFGLGAVESTLVVGEEGTVSGQVSNNGGQTARNAVVVLAGNTQNVEPVETEYPVGDLEPGAAADFSFDVEVSESAAGGPRQLAFLVRYRDRNHEQRESDQLEARVDVGPERDAFAVSPVNATVVAGGGGEIELRVTNQRDEAVSEVSAKLFANDPISTTDDEAFIDRLPPGESETIVFGIGAAPGAIEKTYPVSVDFQYDDADGDTLLSDTYQIPVAVTSPSGGGGPPIVPIVVVLLVIVGFGYYLYRRRSRSG